MSASPVARHARELARDHGVLTVPEVASRLNCSTQTVVRRMHAGLLPYYVVDSHGTRVVAAGDVEALLQQLGAA